MSKHFFGGAAFNRKENGSFSHNSSFSWTNTISFVLFSAHILRLFRSDFDPKPAVNERHFTIFVHDSSILEVSLNYCCAKLLCYGENDHDESHFNSNFHGFSEILNFLSFFFTFMHQISIYYRNLCLYLHLV